MESSIRCMDLSGSPFESQAPPNPELAPDELSRLFYREVAIDYLPGPAADTPEEDIITATLQGAATFELNGNAVSLRGPQLFLFNALMYLRHKEGGIAYSDVAPLGLSPGTAETGRKTAWESGLKYLMKKVNEAAGQDIVYHLRNGRWRRYYVHPGLKLELGEDFEQKPEGFYEFAQVISDGIMRIPTPETIRVDDDDPIEMIVRDNETIVVNNVATQLNQHDRALLHLILLNGGRALSMEQIFGLGFHAYGPPGQAKPSALYRAFHRLDNAMSGDGLRRSLYLHTQREGTLVHTLRSIKVIDVRPQDDDVPLLKSAADDFERLLDLAPQAPDTLPRAEVIKLLDLFGHLLTHTEAYTLSLRLGIVLEPRLGTAITRRKGRGTIPYDSLVPFIIPGTPLPRAFIGELLGGTHDGTVHSSEQYALHKLEIAHGLEQLIDSPFGRLLASVEEIPPELRLEQYLTDKTAKTLVGLLRRPPSEEAAFIAYMAPEGTHAKPNKRDVLNCLVPIRRAYRDFTDALATDDNVRQSVFYAKYQKASDYFLRLLGRPSQDIRNVSFAELSNADPQFAAEGQQLMADFLQVMIAFQKGGLRNFMS